MRGFFGFHSLLKSTDSSVGTVTRLGAGVSGVRTLAGGIKVQKVQTRFGAHPASYTMDIGGLSTQG